MQTPQERKRLIADGKFAELETPESPRWGESLRAVQAAFPGAIVVQQEREPGSPARTQN